MNIIEALRSRILKFLGTFRLNGNPNNERLTYINDDEAIRLSNIRTNRYWYIGDGDELLNWYTNQMVYGYMKNIIYNRNRRKMFWSVSMDENIKRVHSGIPKAIVDTTSNIIGMPNITAGPDDARLKEIFEENGFEMMLVQRSRPLAAVEGDGAWKININPALSKHPLIEWYGAEDWGPIVKSNLLVGMYFKSYYKDKRDRDYVLFETRSKRPNGLAIEFQLYRLDKQDNIVPVDINTIPELSDLQNQLLEGYDGLMAVPLKYYFDPIHPNRGKSMYDGKVDLFDMLDEILTLASQTNRVSSPIEYWPTDMLRRTQNGVPVAPYVYNRQYVKIDSMPDGDGNMNNQIQTTQPDLNFDQYMRLFQDTLGTVLIGILSPSSLGIDIAKDDNADAQREKEKQSIFTRNTFIKNETKALKKLCEMVLDAQDYMDTAIVKNGTHEITIKYDEFANPSFESELQILGPAWTSGEISTERYVSLLWAGKLSDEEMAKEVAWLDENKQKDDFDMSALEGHENEVNGRFGIQGEVKEEESLDEPQKPIPGADIQGMPKR